MDKTKRKTKTSPTAVKKWQSAHLKRYGFPVSLDSEKDIIDRLEAQENKSGYIKSLIRADIKQQEENKMKKISLDNGYSYITPAEALGIIPLDLLAEYMDDETREAVHHELAPCTDEAFLTRYLEIAKKDLVMAYLD